MLDLVYVWMAKVVEWSGFWAWYGMVWHALAYVLCQPTKPTINAGMRFE